MTKHNDSALGLVEYPLIIHVPIHRTHCGLVDPHHGQRQEVKAEQTSTR
jgi:hypothetical protein